MKKNINFLLYATIIITIILLCFSYIFFNNYIKDFLISFSIEIIVYFVINLFPYLFNKIINFNKDYIYERKFREKNIRLSFAYLIRIRVNNKYMLIYKKKRHIFQPVGGVYHFDLDASIREKTKCYRDEHPGDSEDIRVIIKGKNIKKFIKWFNLGREREKSPNREFIEELIDTNILPANLFKELNFKYAKTNYYGINYDNFYKTLQLLRFDIYDFKPTQAQLEFLLNLKENRKKFGYFTKDEIESLGVTKDNDIRTFGTQTPFILEDN